MEKLGQIFKPYTSLWASSVMAIVYGSIAVHIIFTVDPQETVLYNLVSILILATILDIVWCCYKYWTDVRVN